MHTKSHFDVWYSIKYAIIHSFYYFWWFKFSFLGPVQDLSSPVQPWWNLSDRLKVKTITMQCGGKDEPPWPCTDSMTQGSCVSPWIQREEIILLKSSLDIWNYWILSHFEPKFICSSEQTSCKNKKQVSDHHHRRAAGRRVTMISGCVQQYEGSGPNPKKSSAHTTVSVTRSKVAQSALFKSFLSGATSGVVTCVVFQPMDLIKTRLQMTSSASMTSSIVMNGGGMLNINAAAAGENSLFRKFTRTFVLSSSYSLNPRCQTLQLSRYT